MPVSTIARNLEQVRDRIASACRSAGRPGGEVRLMAVSKLHSIASILQAAAAGQTLFGENRVQEMQRKRSDLSVLSPQPSFHLIGHLQSNKAGRAAELFEAVDTVDSLRLAERLNEAGERLGRTLPILIEVKLSHEESKTGLDPRDLPHLLERLPDLHRVELHGLMTVPPWSEDGEQARPYFQRLRRLRDEVAAAHARLDFSELSMGMSGDFAVAIEEGSTCVRIGTAIFGKRDSALESSPDSSPDSAEGIREVLGIVAE